MQVAPFKSIEKSSMSQDVRGKDTRRLKTGASSKSGSKHSSTRTSKQNIPVLNFNKIHFHNFRAAAGQSKPNLKDSAGFKAVRQPKRKGSRGEPEDPLRMMD